MLGRTTQHAGSGTVPNTPKQSFCMSVDPAAATYVLRSSSYVTCLMLLQLYNEEVHDLLSSDQTKLQIHESKESGIYVAGLREDIVTSAEHVLQLLYSGEKLRHFGETKMNKTSSRSHTIFRMVSTTCCM